MLYSKQLSPPTQTLPSLPMTECRVGPMAHVFNARHVYDRDHGCLIVFFAPHAHVAFVWGFAPSKLISGTRRRLHLTSEMESKTKDPFFVIARSAIDTNICKITFAVIEFLPAWPPFVAVVLGFLSSHFFCKLRVQWWIGWQGKGITMQEKQNGNDTT